MKIVLTILSTLFFALSPLEAGLSLPQDTFISDDEVESILEEWLKTLFSAAKLENYKPRIYLIYKDDINAAASTGGQLFLFTGLIDKCDSAEELVGVLAHELGHIKGGHVAQIDVAQQKSLIPAIATVALGAAAAALSGNGEALVAGLSGGAHAFHRSMMKFSQDKENSADQAAISFLESAKWPASGLVKFLKKLQSKSLLHGSDGDSYANTHPPTETRVHTLQERASKMSYELPDRMKRQFARIQAKLRGYLNPYHQVLQKYPLSDTSVSARYARTIAEYRSGKIQQSLNHIEELSKQHPEDPYFLELKGQILFEDGKMQEAIPLFKQAIKHKQNSVMFRMLLGHALLENNQAEEAIGHLTVVTQKNPQQPTAWRLLASAYGKSGKQDRFALAMAEEALLLGHKEKAKKFAEKAKKEAKSEKTRTHAEDILKQL